MEKTTLSREDLQLEDKSPQELKEIADKAAQLEVEKEARRKLREHKRLIKELKAKRQKQSLWTGVAILLVTSLVSLLLQLVFRQGP